MMGSAGTTPKLGISLTGGENSSIAWIFLEGLLTTTGKMGKTESHMYYFFHYLVRKSH